MWWVRTFVELDWLICPKIKFMLIILAAMLVYGFW